MRAVEETSVLFMQLFGEESELLGDVVPGKGVVSGDLACLKAKSDFFLENLQLGLHFRVHVAFLFELLE